MPSIVGMSLRVSLVGYRASGKTTVGRLLASHLKLPFIDLDELIQSRINCSIAEWFTRHGEHTFRIHEAAVLSGTLDNSGDFILSTGGGCILREENRRILSLQGGTVAYLRVSSDILQERLRANGDGRPSLTGHSIVDEVPLVLKRREPLYQAVASVVIDAGPPTGVVARELLRHVQNVSKTGR
jgi:shikimate kinase